MFLAAFDNIYIQVLDLAAFKRECQDEQANKLAK